MDTFVNAGIIKNINFNLIDSIKVISEYYEFTLDTESDCCSSTYFKTFDKDFEYLINKSIISVEEGEIDDSSNYTQLILLKLNDGTEFSFNIIHESNGYYNGWYNIRNFKDLTDPCFNSTIKIILVIGLPGSGKTNYIKKYNTNYHIIDDIFFTSNYIFNIKNIVKTNKNIVIAEPRLCILDRFDEFIKLLLDNFIVSKDQIYIRYFENNKNKCITNIMSREYFVWTQKRYIEDIENMSKVYDTTIDEFKKYKNYILKVYDVENHSAILIQKIYRGYMEYHKSFLPGGIEYLKAKKFIL